ncbi:MAG: hypothetical protein ACXU8R_13165 [Xanthobacteraceae bacterium]
MNKRVTYDVISYGEWTRPRMKNFREQCCDCGLIHRLDFRIVDGKVEFRTRRDDRATAAASGSRRMNELLRARSMHFQREERVK